MSLSGIIIIDKPAGWTSHDVVAKLRGVFKQKRIGHGGTLDPMATGVLPVFIGRATRAAEFCENAEKEYIAGLRLGIVTDTQDITGTALSEHDVTVTAGDVKHILPRFTGAQKQIPPMYSAVKQGGKKLYELARKGIDVPREARDITISALEMTEASGGNDYTLRVVCSKGTYIRTLCHDIGEALGCGGTLSSLRRTRAGVFTIENAHSPDEITQGDGSSVLLPVDTLFQKFPAITLTENSTKQAKNGALHSIGEANPGTYRFYAPDGEFLLLGDIKNNKVKTVKSFYEV